MNEAEYLMKNYGEQGGCYPSRPRPITPSEISIILHMHDTKTEFNNCFIIHSKQETIKGTESALPIYTLFHTEFVSSYF